MEKHKTKIENGHAENFIQAQNNCPLCGNELEIETESYLENYTLREEAHCPKCQVLARVKDHKMH